MQVRVLFFGSLRDLIGKTSDSVSLPEGADLTALLEHYTRNKPAISGLVPSLALSVNQEYASRSTKLRDHDEVALLPPVSGGTELKGKYCEIVRQAISTQAIADGMKRGEDGAVVVFEGIV